MRKRCGQRVMWRVLCGGLIAAGAIVFAERAARADTVEFPALVSPFKVKIVVVGSPGGLAVDDSKNIYFSDQGSGLPESGRLVMLRKGNDSAIVIVEGLTKRARRGRAAARRVTVNDCGENSWLIGPLPLSGMVARGGEGRPAHLRRK